MITLPISSMISHLNHVNDSLKFHHDNTSKNVSILLSCKTFEAETLGNILFVEHISFMFFY